MFVFQPLTTADIIEIVGITISLITGIIAIVISVKTLKQNSQMIEESTRPYVTIYSAKTNFQSPNFYLIMKNFGQSSALITSFDCDHDLADFSYREEFIPFSHIVGTSIAPGQSFSCTLHSQKLFKEPVILQFQIEYTANGKNYTESITINPKTQSELVQTRASTSGKELHVISYTLQDLVEKML